MPVHLAKHPDQSYFTSLKKPFLVMITSMQLQFVVEITLRLLLATRGTTVHLGSDGVGDVGQLLLLLLKVLSGSVSAVLVEPLSSLLDGIQNLRILLVISYYCTGLQVTLWHKLTVSFSSSLILPPRPSASLTWFFKLKA